MRILSFDVGIRNLSYCLVELDDDGARLEQWDVVDVVEFSGSKAKTKSLGMMRTVDMLIKYLEHKRGDWHDARVDVVCIEQQLARAATLKVVQFALYTFAKVVFPDAKVTLCHAKKKLAVDLRPFGCEEEFKLPAARKRKQPAELTKKQQEGRAKSAAYRRNKLLCVWSAGRVLAHMRLQDADAAAPFEALFEGTKKQDDLADALMQAVAVYQKV